MTSEEQKIVSKVFFPHYKVNVNLSNYNHLNVRKFYEEKGTNYSDFSV